MRACAQRQDAPRKCDRGASFTSHGTHEAMSGGSRLSAKTCPACEPSLQCQRRPTRGMSSVVTEVLCHTCIQKCLARGNARGLRCLWHGRLGISHTRQSEGSSIGARGTCLACHSAQSFRASFVLFNVSQSVCVQVRARARIPFHSLSPPLPTLHTPLSRPRGGGCP